ncbi:DUF4376 domain-containing protein [Terrarubrum flagellatum]|uniref:DUF4376 domain-containing protein n=1 Tax=Terrirubrum flagellatum TaxID=2895980 RepID=UPI00314556B2
MATPKGKTVYQTDEAGVFVGTAIADPDPLQSGAYLIPRNAHDLAPPQFNKSTHFARWNGTGWTISPLGAQNVPGTQEESLLARAARLRWERETRGVLVSGLSVGSMAVRTDDRSKMMIMGARVAAEADPNFTTTWAASDDSLHEINATDVVIMSNAVLAHVAESFALYAMVKAEITSGAIKTAAEVDAAYA